MFSTERPGFGHRTMGKPDPEADTRGVADKLVSPNGFDGRGPVPEKVTAAAKTLARLRVKFIHQWTPGADGLLTTREIEQLFDASAIQAEWIRELYEVVHADV